MQSSPIIHRRRSAFTLVEAMITVVIVSIGMIASLQLLTFQHTVNTLEQERARARQIVGEEMERLRHELYTRIEGGKSVTVWDNGTPDDKADDTTGVLAVTVRDTKGVAVFVAPNPAERVEVEVTLSWNPRGRFSDKTFQETVMTYIAP